MYYHNSPTVKQIKEIKASRAADMANATASMKAISNEYKQILKDLDELRKKELTADQILARYPEKTDEINKIMAHKYKIMAHRIERFLSVEQ